MTHTLFHKPARKLLSIFAVLALLLLPGLTAFAQDTNLGAITGTVTDTSGAAIANTAVTITNQGTGEKHVATTSSKGFYTVEDLPDGDYTLAVAAQGFSPTTITNIHLDPGQRRGQNVQLQVGSVSTRVTVQADALAVQTQSAEAGGTITAKEVQNLMLNGRNFQALLTVVPGVSDVNGANGFYQAGQGAITSETIVNGSSGEETMYTIDGIYNDTSSSDVTVPVTPTVDFINEMRVLSDNYSARYGLAGRQILVNTKSGTDQYHGSFYGYSRSNEFGTARPYTYTPAQPLASLHLTDWGLTLGGPLAIPHVFNTDHHTKIFFFVGADWKANHYANSLSSRNTFTSAIRGGDLSTEPVITTGADMKPYASLDAYHQAILAARYPTNPAACIFQESGSGNYNGILPACMDPNTVTLMNTFWPNPNYSVPGQGNFINTNPVKFSDNEQIYRGDYNINDNNLITLRIMHEEVTQINSSRNYNDPAPNPNSIPYTPSGNDMLRWQWTISPNILNTASVGLVYTKYYNNLAGDYTLPSSVHINQAFPDNDPLNRMPNIEMINDAQGSENWFWMGIGALPTFSNDATTEISDDFTWVKGAHTLQTGFTYMWNLLHVNAASALPMGIFCFDGAISGDTAGDYLLGFLANASPSCSNSFSSGYAQTNVQRSGDFRNHWPEIYVQDDWRYNARLTLNLGMRWSYFSAPTMDGNQVANFVPSAYLAADAPPTCPYTSGSGCASATWMYLNSSNQPLTSSGTVANLYNGMVTACQGTPCGFTNPPKGLFAPRLGFAYELTRDGKTSIHGGVGFGYTQVSLLQTSNLLSNPPFAQTPTYNGTEFTNPTGTGTAGPPGLQAPTVTASDYRAATVRNYSLTVERQLMPGAIFSVGYAGMTTQHIFTGSYDQNFPNSGVVSSSASATCAASSGIAGQPTTGFSYDPCINTGTVNSNYFRPYQGYGTISTGASFGVANYNALLVGYVQKTHDLTAHVSYTWSKSLGDINDSGIQVAYSSAATFQNPHNPLGDYGRPDYDRPNEFVYSLVYDIPAFTHSSSHLERTLLGGFSLASYFIAESGFAETPTYSSGLATRPNASGTLYRNHGTSGKPGQQPVYSYQNFSRPDYGFFGSATVGSLRAPKEVALHVSAEKAFELVGRLNLKLGAQAFNVLNHPNVLGLNTAWSPNSQGTFGTASAYGDPRQMQFYAKVQF